MTLTEYRAHPACNFSSLKYLLKSPAHYQAALNEPRTETPAMLLGTLTHSVALEGKELRDIATIKPTGMRLNTKDGKAWLESQNPNLLVIGEDEAMDIAGMAASIQANPHARHALSQCQHRETPVLSTIHGVDCKALLDAHGTDGVEWCIVDLKTTDDASPEAFARKVANLHYDMQAALYCAALSRAEQIESRPYWLWIAVEKTPPYACAVYSDTQWIESGELKMERVLQSWRECTESGEWPMPWQGINELPKPSWA